MVKKNAQTKNPQIITYEMEHTEMCLLKVKNLWHESDIQLNFKNRVQFKIALLNTYHPLHTVLFKYDRAEYSIKYLLVNSVMANDFPLIQCIIVLQSSFFCFSIITASAISNYIWRCRKIREVKKETPPLVTSSPSFLQNN